jgi:hypothetical protein
MIREFDCVECRRHIVRFGLGEDEETPALCAECLHVPGWYQDPALRQRFDPGGDLDDDAIREAVNPKENDDG